MKKLKIYIRSALLILNKYYWKIIFGVFIAYMLYAILSYCYLYTMVDEYDKAKDFKVSSIINIDEKRIDYRKEIHVKGEFAISFFTVDSLYNFLVVKLGVDSLNVEKMFVSSLDKKKLKEAGEPLDGVILNNVNPNYTIGVVLDNFPIKKRNTYYLTSFIDFESYQNKKSDEYSFRMNSFSIENDVERHILYFQGLVHSLRMTVNLKNYKDSNGNFYAFILYQDEDKDFLSIKEILEKEQRKLIQN